MVLGEVEEEGLPSSPEGVFAGRFRCWMRNLTGEQRNELASEIQQLRAQIRARIRSKLEEWGVQPCERLLTEEQIEELRTGIQALKDLNATSEDIRDYVQGKLDEWGVEAPALGGCGGGFAMRSQMGRRSRGGFSRRGSGSSTGTRGGKTGSMGTSA